MAKPRTIPEEKLQFKDAPSLIWIKVSNAVKLLWNENPKLHSIGDLVESIKKHGFQELPKLDSNLVNVLEKKGAIKAGNGRVEALAWMEKDGNYDLPRGLAKIKETGEWVTPLLVGTDAESVDLARAYAIDGNNLVISGGNTTIFNSLDLYDQKSYVSLLEDLAKHDSLPVSVSGDDLDFLLNFIYNEHENNDQNLIVPNCSKIDYVQELREGRLIILKTTSFWLLFHYLEYNDHEFSYDKEHKQSSHFRYQNAMLCLMPNL